MVLLAGQLTLLNLNLTFRLDDAVVVLALLPMSAPSVLLAKVFPSEEESPPTVQTRSALVEWLQMKPSLLFVMVLLVKVKLSVALSIELTCAPCVELLLKKLFCIRIVALDVFCISTL